VQFDHKVVYITRDIERAYGIPLDTPGYVIITNRTETATQLQSQYGECVVCIDSGKYLDTHELLAHSDTVQWMSNHTDARILVFKNSTRIERICEGHGWNLLNPSAVLANTVEQKLSQLDWLDDLKSLLPPHKIKLCKDMTEADIPCVIQFNHGHTGTSTMRLSTITDLEQTQQLYPERPARMSAYIDGMMFTLNSVVAHNGIFPSTMSYQITGIPPFTDNPFATVGNDWVFPKKVLSKVQEMTIDDIARHVGKKLQADGWLGLFGIDVIVEKNTDNVYLIEINARQPASSSYESALQGTFHPTTMEAHIRALLGQSLTTPIAPILAGAQLFDRRVDPPIVHQFPSGIMAEHGILSAAIVRSL